MAQELAGKSRTGQPRTKVKKDKHREEVTPPPVTPPVQSDDTTKRGGGDGDH